MPLTQDRNTPKRNGDMLALPMAVAVVYAGGLACINSSGYATPGATSTSLIAVGRFNETVDNRDGNAGDRLVSVERGIFRYDNSSSADEITLASVGSACYIVDDETVAKTSGSGTRSRAGIVVDVDDDGVWVEVGYLAAVAGALVPANNLSDLGNAATARTNLGGGANKIVLQIQGMDLVGSNAVVYRVVSPVAGSLDSIRSVINGALATADATLTAKINGSAVTNGVITITQSGSAANDVDSASPTAAKTVAVGDVISLTVGGGNTASKLADAVLTITPSA